MVSDKTDLSSRSLLLTSVVILVLVTIVAVITRLWVLTAIPIGFLFGFFLEKADLCGSSAFSEVILMKDSRKLWGLWIVIVVSMIGFALLDFFDLITLNPRPFFWASYIVGGVLFGSGMVLAGGCISGSLFKTGQGNMNSMAALVAIPLGIAAVEYGPLKGLNQSLLQKVISSTDGGPVTLPSLTGLSYQALAIVFVLVTIAVVFLSQRRNPLKKLPKENNKPLLLRLIAHPWKPWQAGIVIGILASFAYLSSAASGRNYPLGVTHGVLQTQLLVTDYPLEHVWSKAPLNQEMTKAMVVKKDPKENQKPPKKIFWWLILEVVSLVVGANVSARLSGKIKFAPKPPDEMIFAFVGGLLTGAGAALAGGCMIGNIMSGFALMSVGNMLFGIVVMLTNWITTYFYMLGAQWTH